jgi:hypothetical protein
MGSLKMTPSTSVRKRLSFWLNGLVKGGCTHSNRTLLLLIKRMALVEFLTTRFQVQLFYNPQSEIIKFSLLNQLIVVSIKLYFLSKMLFKGKEFQIRAKNVIWAPARHQLDLYQFNSPHKLTVRIGKLISQLTLLHHHRLLNQEPLHLSLYKSTIDSQFIGSHY